MPLLPLTRSIPLALAAALTVATSCTSQTPEPAPPVKPPPAGGGAAESAVFDPAKLAAELCAGKPGCTLQKLHPAGKGPQGEVLSVVELAIANGPAGDSGDYVPQCQPHRQQFYRVIQRGGTVETAYLMNLCNDGYGAAGLGEDYITVSDNQLVHQQSGGSASRWGFSRAYSLLPLQLKTNSSCSYHAAAGNAQQVNSDWLSLRSSSRWDANTCGSEDEVAYDCDAPSLRFQYDLIPRLPDGSGALDWSATALGSCAWAMDASGSGGGYITFGEPAAAADAKMKVLLADKRTLVVEVLDDNWVSGAKSWLYDDHLELWVGEDMQMGFCIEGKGETTQWGVRISDGAVFVGRGSRPWKPTVKRFPFSEGGQQGTRLVIGLGEDADVITVVYSDSDDGKTQERLMATSRVKYAEAATLGRTIDVTAEGGACKVGPSLSWQPAIIATKPGTAALVDTDGDL